MCGISVAYQFNSAFSESDWQSFEKSLMVIRHRGPDGSGITLFNTETGILNDVEEPFSRQPFSANLALGHVRLSILDLSEAGKQPLHYERYTITFNGEIYNYIEIRSELQGLGYTFRTHTDTEVILAAYDRWGSNCLSKFNGMFSFVIADRKKKVLFIANDRFGVKPLYYYLKDDVLLLASELKQFKCYDLKLTVNDEVIRYFLDTQYVDYSEETFYKEIRRFPKSHYCIIPWSESPELKFERYYSIKRVSLHEKSVPEQFHSLLTDAVKLRLRSDVPVGFASSGGLDSSSILYMAHSLLKSEGLQKNVQTFSAIFPGLDGDESEFIRLVEKDLEVNANYVNPLELFSMDDFEKHIYHQDMPVTSTSYYAEWCVARKVNQQGVKVLLIGQGGDELLAGYHHHFYRYCRQLILRGQIPAYLSQVKQYAGLKGVAASDVHRKVLNEVKLAVKFRFGLASFGNGLQEKWNKINTLTEVLKTDLTETMLPAYLRSDDRDAMAFGLETRHPFLDYRLVDFCFSLPDTYKIKEGWQKWLLRQIDTAMPDAIRYRKDKKGYTTPQDIWLESNREAFETYLNYLPEPYRNYKVSDRFLLYALGAWFKVNE
ncbi:MAG: asparagine synthase (glutamine-hydrolyzing) [Sediminibacterium sp.]|nr:asparagine synthase (glutamine-hydrolyzing) [Sediminibacterium sp.]